MRRLPVWLFLCCLTAATDGHAVQVLSLPPQLSSPGGAVNFGNTALLRYVDVQPRQVIFTAAGQTERLDVVAEFVGASSADVTGLAGYSYVSDNPSVVTVDQLGNLTSVGQGTATVSISNLSVVGVTALVSVEVNPTIWVSTITITPLSISLSSLGDHQQLNVLGKFSDGRTFDLTRNSMISYSAHFPGIATPDQFGNVFAQGNGDVVVIVRSGPAAAVMSASVQITKSVSSLVASEPRKILRQSGATTQLVVQGTYSDGSTADLTSHYDGTTYATSASTVATVSPDGLISAANSGVALITISNSGVTTTVSLKVSISSLQALTIQPSGIPIAINSMAPIATQRLTVTGTYSDGTFEDLTSSTSGTGYHSSNGAIASVAPSGLVAFSQSGSVNIMANNSGQTTSAAFQVSEFNPIFVGQVHIPQVNNAAGTNNVKVSGAFAYVATASGLTVVNVSAPRSPTVVGSITLGGNATDLAVRNSLAYVADGANLAVVDISAPTNPSLIGTVNTGGTVGSVALSPDGSTLYLVDSIGLKVASLANPRAPAIIGSVSTSGSMKGIALGGNLAFLAQGARVTIVDVSTPTAPTIASSLAIQANGISAAGNFAYVAGGPEEAVQIINAANPAAPFLSGITNLTVEAPAGTVVKGSLVLSAIASGLFVPIFNVSDPFNPTYIGFVSFPGQSTRLDADANFVYAIGDSGELMIGMYAPQMPPVPPSVNLLSPLPGANVADGGVVQVAAQASDSLGIQAVDYLVNGVIQSTAVPPVLTTTVRIPPGNIGQTVSIGAQAINLSGTPSAISSVLVNVVADPLTTVQGKVVLADGTPVPNATVKLLSSLATLTQADGTFSFAGVPTSLGTIVLSATATVSGMLISASELTSPVPGGVTDFGTVTMSASPSAIAWGTLTPGAYQMPYGLAVPQGKTLTLAAGTIIKMGGGMQIDGTLISSGTATAPVVITSQSDNTVGGTIPGSFGDWNQIVISPLGSGSSFQNTIVRFGQGLNIQSNSVSLQNCTFDRNEQSAVYMDAQSSLLGSGNQFIPLSFNAPLPGFPSQAVMVSGGTMLRSATWTESGMPFIISKDFFVGTGTTSVVWTVGPGVQVLTRSSVIVRDQLVAQGTPGLPVLFSRNPSNDGFSNPVGAWGGLDLVNPSVPSQLQNVVVRWGGDGVITTVNPDGSTSVTNGPATGNIIVAGAGPTIQGGELSDGAGAGIQITATAASVSLNAVAIASNSVGIDVSAAGPGQQVTLSNSRFAYNRGAIVLGNAAGGWSIVDGGGNTFESDNGTNGIAIPPGTMSNSSTWTGLLPYVINSAGTLQIGSGSGAVVWTLQPGVIVKGTTYGVTVNDQMLAQGISGQPIVFTSNHDTIGGMTTPASDGNVGGGLWTGFQFTVTSTASLSYVAVRYAGENSQPAIRVTNTSPSFSHVEVSTSASQAFQFEGASFSTVTASVIQYSIEGVRATGGAIPTVQNSSIIGNQFFGYLNDTPDVDGTPGETTLDATNNWWGTPNGPTQAGNNTPGTGNQVSLGVTYVPFLTAAPVGVGVGP